MPFEHADEAQRLSEHYAQMYDAEILSLAAGADDLTDVAKQVLANELKKRGLTEEGSAPDERPGTAGYMPPPPAAWETPLGMSPDGESDDEPQDSHGFTWKTLLCECETREQAWQVFEVLRRAGVQSWIEAPQSYSLELSGQRVVVAADQLDPARAILQHPIPQDIIDESKMQIPEFETPTCPHCGAADPILEAVEGANAWSCDVCGAQWTDSAAAPEHSAGK